MSRLRPVRRTREVNQPPSEVFFDCENGVKCGLCNIRHGRLIGPCQCQIKYHQSCLLTYINGLIRRTLRSSEEMDVSQIKCRKCNQRYHLIYEHKYQYSCSTFKKRVQKTLGGKHSAITVVLVVLITTLVVILVKLRKYIQQKNATNLLYGLIAVIVGLAIIQVFVLGSFFHYNLMIHQIILQGVYQPIDIRSLASSSSDDNVIDNNTTIVILANQT